VGLTTRDVLLIGHVAFAVVALGPVTLAVSMFPRHVLLAFSDPPAPGTAELLHRISRTYAQIAIAVPALGVVLALEIGYLSFFWTQAALAVTGAAAAVLGVGVIPDQRKVLAGADPRPMSGRLHGLAGLSRSAGSSPSHSWSSSRHERATAAIDTRAPRSVVLAGLIEAVSYLVLIATALWRRALDGPDVAGLVGPTHGIAFLTYCTSVIAAREGAGWNLWRAASLLAAAIVPGGGFVVAWRSDQRPPSTPGL
jgi:integral membrane protein